MNIKINEYRTLIKAILSPVINIIIIENIIKKSDIYFLYNSFDFKIEIIAKINKNFSI